MIHYTSKSGKEYFVIQTTFEASNVKVPIQIQINVTGLDDYKKTTIHKKAAIFLNRPLRITDPKPVPVLPPSKKPWWKVW